MGIVFPIVAAIIDRETVFSAGLQLNEVHTIYFDPMNALPFRRNVVRFSDRETSKVADKIPDPKNCVEQLCGTLEHVHLFTPMFHLLYHVFKAPLCSQILVPSTLLDMSTSTSSLGSSVE